MKSGVKQNGFLEKYELFTKAYDALEKGIVEYNQNPNSEVMKAGIIKMYEFTWELSWKTLKEYIEEQNIEFLPSPRQTIKEAYQLTILNDEDTWMNILDDRNIMNHTYDQMKANELVPRIINEYFVAFRNLKMTFKKLSLNYEKE
jgi:nucleotidyltransferase substrate binding protein (TIGR01987 family)